MKDITLSKKLAFTALFSALCFVGTYAIPVALPFGYFNAGDIFVLLSGWLLGPLFGAVAAGVGSALADVALGYAAYAPATFVVKACVALVGRLAYAFFKKLLQRDALDFLPRLFAGVVAEAVMVAGYLFFEGVLLGLGAGALASVLGNVLQAVCGVLGATAIVSALYPLPVVHKIFPSIEAFVGRVS